MTSTPPDTAALIGLSVGLMELYLAHRYSNPYFYGAASILIGVTLSTVSVILIRERKGPGRRPPRPK
jgi:hypothetical protein